MVHLRVTGKENLYVRTLTPPFRMRWRRG